MANTIGVVFTRAVESLQNLFATIKNAIGTGLGSVKLAIMHLFEGKEKNSISTVPLTMDDFLIIEDTSKSTSFLEGFRKASSKEEKMHYLRVWGDAIGMPGSKTTEEPLKSKNEAEIPALLKPRSDVQVGAESAKQMVKIAKKKEAFFNELLGVFGGSKYQWKAEAEILRAEINKAAGEFFQAYKLEKFDEAKQKEIEDNLYASLLKIQDAKDEIKLSEKLKNLKAAKADIEALTQAVK